MRGTKGEFLRSALARVPWRCLGGGVSGAKTGVPTVITELARARVLAAVVTVVIGDLWFREFS